MNIYCILDLTVVVLETPSIQNFPMTNY